MRRLNDRSLVWGRGADMLQTCRVRDHIIDYIPRRRVVTASLSITAFTVNASGAVFSQFLWLGGRRRAIDISS